MINMERILMRDAANRAHKQHQEYLASLRPLDQTFNSIEAANSIKNAFTHPSSFELIMNNLNQLVIMQFDESRVWGELAGRIGKTENALCFEPIPSQNEAGYHECYLSLKNNGDKMAAYILAHLVQEYRFLFSDSYDGLNTQPLQLLEEKLFQYSKKAFASLDTSDFQYLESIMKSATSIQVGTLRPDQPDFLGAFHFHPNGTPPNDADYEQTTKLGVPMVIVSAIPNHNQITGVYLIANGEFDCLVEV
jgi:hypothetical protein